MEPFRNSHSKKKYVYILGVRDFIKQNFIVGDELFYILRNHRFSIFIETSPNRIRSSLIFFYILE